VVRRWNLLPSTLFLLGAILSFSPDARSQEHFSLNSIGIKMIRIEPGSFWMGNPDPEADSWDEQPIHKVAISQPFYVSETEITVEQFQQFRSEYVCAGNHWTEEDEKLWAWTHRDDGTSLWTQWWPNGEKKSESTWRDGRCEDVAKCWDRSGKLINNRRGSP